jgi:hypothetical protein
MRGPSPRDAASFADKSLASIQTAVVDLSWLLGRGYSAKASAKLVGDRFQLDGRQRHAMSRASVPEALCVSRAKSRIVGPLPEQIWVDGFNVLITVERLLGGAVVMRCRDGVLRDIGGVHGTYRPSEATHAALTCIAEATPGVHLRWLFDAPISNSGRVAALVRAKAEAEGLDWQAETVPSPDGVLPDAPCAATGDGPVIDRCASWVDLPALAVPDGHVVPL